METDVINYSLQQAVTNAIEMSTKYNKNYAVVPTEDKKGYAVIGARYAKFNKDKLDIEFITDIHK